MPRMAIPIDCSVSQRSTVFLFGTFIKKKRKGENLFGILSLTAVSNFACMATAGEKFLFHLAKFGNFIEKQSMALGKRVFRLNSILNINRPFQVWNVRDYLHSLIRLLYSETERVKSPFMCHLVQSMHLT